MDAILSTSLVSEGAVLYARSGNISRIRLGGDLKACLDWRGERVGKSQDVKARSSHLPLLQESSGCHLEHFGSA